MIIYLFQKPLWLLLSQGAKGTVTMSIRMRPRPGSQSASFSSCVKGTTGDELVLLSMQQPKILASLVMNSDRVTSRKTIVHTNKGKLDQDQLKYYFVGLWTPTGSRVQVKEIQAVTMFLNR
jgi:hypothetical protein